ncbi:MAG: magnesium-transporting ATPase, partial [Lactobacillus sp.]|nr:magnesium-transporting ATPase [Lactobacillus sp.]
MLKMLKINTSGTRHTTDTKLVRRIAREDKFATLQRLKTSISGLPSKDARQRLEKNGPNEIASKQKNTRLQFLCEAFMTPFTIVLLCLAVLS